MTNLRDLSSAKQSWMLIDTAHRLAKEYGRRATENDFSPAGWLPATVPGMVAVDLLKAGRIPDPFYGDNIMASRWVEERDWVWRTVIEVTEAEAAAPCRLVCESLDAFAAVWLNGVRVAEHNNQFRRLTLDLTGQLKPGRNILLMGFEAVMPGTVRRAGERLPFWNEPWERLFVRRSQMAYGWDWASRTPITGILGAIRLEFATGVWAGDLHVQATPTAAGVRGPGRLRVGLPLTATGDGAATATVRLNGQAVTTQRLDLRRGQATQVTVDVTVPDVAYWFPRELGEPMLHDIEVVVTAADGRELQRDLHRELHRANLRVGFRTIELQKRDPASPNGKVFRFAINGERLWAKGENWLPIDFLHTRVTPEQYRDYLTLLMAGGVNCIRIWGGGIIEHAAFYDLCDELGLIVWHDFFFACGVYPTTPEFLAEVQTEARDMVSRLRSRTCIAMWCGNNENEVLANSQVDTGNPPEMRNHPIYYQIIPAVLAELDPERAWWPGSPASESLDVHPDSDSEGDRHNWDVWFGWQRTDHIGDLARFNSEFGAQSFPQKETIESFMHPEDAFSPGQVSRLQGMSPGLVLARHGAQFEKLFARAGAFGSLNGLDQIIATTQAFQADTIGRYIRHYRRNIAFTGGVVVWNYTSTWPSVCWALIDWYRRPKQAFYECRRAFRPLTVGIEPSSPEQATFIAHVSRDRPGRSTGSVTLNLHRISDGSVVATATGSFDLSGSRAASPAQLTLPIGLDRTTHALVAVATHGDGVECDYRYLCLLNDVAETLGGRRLVHAKPNTLTVTRHADHIEIATTAWRVRVGLESLEQPAVWDDNYLDLLPGESRTLRIAHGRMPEHIWVVADMGTRSKLPRGATITL